MRLLCKSLDGHKKGAMRAECGKPFRAYEVKFDVRKNYGALLPPPIPFLSNKCGVFSPRRMCHRGNGSMKSRGLSSRALGLVIRAEKKYTLFIFCVELFLKSRRKLCVELLDMSEMNLPRRF